MGHHTAHRQGIVADTDTIAAIATPPGKGGVGIVRVSGSQVQAVIAVLTKRQVIPRNAHYLPFFDEDGSVIDTGLCLFFDHPHSFTGEDVVEFHGHGGPVVMDLLLERVLQLNVRMAHAGEFTERAFLNDKMDLAQAEAVADLINSASRQAARSAMRSLQGEFSGKIQALQEKMIELRCFVEGAIDFPEEEIDFLSDQRITDTLAILISQLQKISQAAEQGSLLRDGIHVAIAGQPNAGKSSLLNCLAQREAAIVSEIPGTTRDVLREQIVLDGVPVHIIDTAGIRDSDDVVEKKGIERAWNAIENADIVLLLIDDVQGFMDADAVILDKIPPEKPLIHVFNKIDLSGESAGVEGDIARLSVKDNQGMDDFCTLLKQKTGLENQPEGTFIARRRHLTALQQATIAIQRGQQQLKEHRAGEILAEELRIAQQALGDITGEYSNEDLLGDIFSRFCIGK